MAKSDEDTLFRYPLMAYNFRVIVGESIMSFSEVSGLQRAYETVTYRHGLGFWEGEQIAKYRLDTYQPLTLKKGTMALGDTALYRWLEQRMKVPMMISLCDEEASPVVTWRVAKVIPVKLSAPSFTAESNDISIDTLELMAAGITIEA